MPKRKPRTDPLNRFYQHRDGAKTRGIQFLLSFEEWLKIWMDSGHWHERGLGKGKYNMARFNDVGPYAINNVKIIKHEENAKEGNEGKILSEGTRNKIRLTRLGSFHGSREQSAKNAYRMGISNKGRTHTLEARAKMSATHRRRLEASNS